MGWGLCTLAGVAGKGETLDVIPRFLITGRRIAGTSFGGAKGRDRVPELVRLYLDGPARSRRVRLPPHAARRRQPRLRADGAPGRHPIRAHLQLHDLRTHHGRWLALQQLRRRRPPRRPRDPDRRGRAARADQRGDRALPAAADPRAADAPPRATTSRTSTSTARALRGAGARARARGRRDRRRRHARSPTATSSRAAGCASTCSTPRATAPACSRSSSTARSASPGDTLFAGSVGGVHAPGSTSFADLRSSIMDKLMALDPAIILNPGHVGHSTVGAEWRENAFIRLWRGLDAEGDEPCTALGKPATLILWGDDYDGGHKAWVRWPDGSDDIVPGSRVERARMRGHPRRRRARLARARSSASRARASRSAASTARSPPGPSPATPGCSPAAIPPSVVASARFVEYELLTVEEAFDRYGYGTGALTRRARARAALARAGRRRRPGRAVRLGRARRPHLGRPAVQRARARRHRRHARADRRAAAPRRRPGRRAPRLLGSRLRAAPIGQPPHGPCCGAARSRCCSPAAALVGGIAAAQGHSGGGARPRRRRARTRRSTDPDTGDTTTVGPARRRRRRPRRARRPASPSRSSGSATWCSRRASACRPTAGASRSPPSSRTLQGADLTFGNLEETMSTTSGSKCGAGSSNCYAFQAPPSHVAAAAQRPASTS